MSITESNPLARTGVNSDSEADLRTPDLPKLEAAEEIAPSASYASPPCYLAEFADFEADSVVAN